MVYFLGEYVAFPEEAYPSSQCHCGHRSVLKSFILWNSWVLWFLQCSVVLTLSHKSQDTKLALMTLSGLSSASYFCCVCYAVPTLSARAYDKLAYRDVCLFELTAINVSTLNSW